MLPGTDAALRLISYNWWSNWVRVALLWPVSLAWSCHWDGHRERTDFHAKFANHKLFLDRRNRMPCTHTESHLSQHRQTLWLVVITLCKGSSGSSISVRNNMFFFLSVFCSEVSTTLMILTWSLNQHTEVVNKPNIYFCNSEPCIVLNTGPLSLHLHSISLSFAVLHLKRNYLLEHLNKIP